MAKQPRQNSNDQEQEHDKSVDQNEQPLIAHLIALRRCVLHSLIAVVVLCIPYFIFSQQAFAFIASVLTEYSSNDLLATKVMEPFLAQLKLALVLGVYTAMPYILFQLWSFVSPGLYFREKKFAVPLVVTSVCLFYIGVAFSFFVVFPLVFNFMVSILPEDVAWLPTMNDYLSFVFKVPFAFGLVFEIPIAIVLLVGTGIMSVKTLSKARPFIFVGCFVLGMLLTPPDVISQFLLAIPAWILYEFGLLFARLIKKRSTKS